MENKTMEEAKREFYNKFTAKSPLEGNKNLFWQEAEPVWQWIEELIQKEREEAIKNYLDQLEQQKIKEHKCEVETCDRKRVCKGYCFKHYRRWKRTGSTIIHRD